MGWSARSNANAKEEEIDCPSELELEGYPRTKLTIGHYHERHYDSTIQLEDGQGDTAGVAERVQGQIDQARGMDDLMLLVVMLDQEEERQGTERDNASDLLLCRVFQGQGSAGSI